MSSVLRRLATGATVATVAALALTSCSGGAADPQTSGPVTIVVGGEPPATQEAARALFLERVAAFQEANPDITIEPSETVYDPQTFAAQLAGGTMPDVMGVPVTDIQSLIARDQVKDLSSYFDSSEVLQSLNPSVTANVQNGDGAYFGIPVSAFTLSLMINRAVFAQAGLDPDTTPLETWDDVAKAAATISDKTDVAGLAQLTSSNQGGWVLTAMTAAFGDRMEATADGKTTATVDTDAATEVLEYLKALRWDADALGSNFLLGFDDVAPLFASGQYGMLVGASEWYNKFTTGFGMAPDDFGLYPLPQTSNGLGSLGGGSVGIVRPDATDAETAAAVKWIEYYYLQRYSNLDFAAEEAAATAKDGGAVPRVNLPLVAPDAYAAYLGAIEPSINVPLQNLEAYLTASESPDFKVVTEPAVEAQQLYAILDSVVQAVLTDQNADIPALLASAQQNASSIVNAAQ
jgi:multiple sugar transport system substrate-binding protein